ncbi:hypothetical protein ACFQ2B_01950 [Streptomyces stramineus]
MAAPLARPGGGAGAGAAPGAAGRRGGRGPRRPGRPGPLGPRRVFARHRRGLDRLLHALAAGARTGSGTVPVPALVAEAASVVLLDRVSRERVAAVEFGSCRHLPLPSREAPPSGARVA